MADEVVIRLQAQSAQLEASIGRLEKSLLRLETRSKRANAAMQTGAARTSKSINNQNKSFTLMVAKLALVTFAAQTMANIFQSTFGAILKTIDDFQVAAIGAAAAVTSITASGEPIGEVFDQNLEASLQTFEKLELVAARFFSTGQELQLAFNTLAQRGVVIREDEFEILGKLTDQIKLLTGGQNSQIQIQQELRAILDGNVRTTTAFGKSLQARGVDIQQLSREVRATGSIEVFEQFLTGLDAAGGSIRRTLQSVTTTFKSLFAILTRNIFQDTYDDIVSQITLVNNFIIEQREELIKVGRVIVDKIKGGFQLVVGVLKEIIDLISDLGTSKIGQLLIFFKALASIGSTPLRVLLLIGGVIAGMTGNFESVADAVDIFVKSIRIGLKVLENGLDTLLDFENLISNLEQGFRGLQNVNLIAQEGALEEQLAGLTPEQREGTRGQRLEEELARVRANINNNVAAIERNIAEAGNEAGESFTEGLGKALEKGLKDLNIELDNKMDELGIVDTEDRIKAAFDNLLKQAEALETKPEAEFVETIPPFIFDTTAMKAGLKNAEQLNSAALARIDKERAAFSRLEQNRNNLELAERKKTGLEAFNEEVNINKQRQLENIKALEVRKQQIKDQLAAELQILEIDRAVTEGPNQLQPQEAQLKEAQLLTAEKVKQQRLDQQIAVIRGKLDQESLKVQQEITEENRKVNRLLQERRFELEGFGGGLTNAERLAQVQTRGRQASADFAAENRGDAAAIAEFNAQQAQQNLNELIATQVNAFTNAIDQAFGALIDGIVEGAFEFRDLAQTISKDLIKAGLEGLINQAKDAVTKGLQSIFGAVGEESAQAAAQALAVGIGLLLAILSRIGNEGDFTATGGGAGGSGVQSTGQVRGLIGGDTSLPIAQINEGLQEALIPTNVILSQIERNTRPLADLGASGSLDLNAIISEQVNQIFENALLQGTP